MNLDLGFDFVLFDLDGTLVDSRIDFDGIRNALGIDRQTDILGHLESLKSAFSISGQEEDEKAYQTAEKIIFDYEFQAAQNAVNISGATDFVTFLNHYRIPCGIVTRNNAEIAKQQLRNFEGDFLDVLARDDVAKPKPDPESFNFYANKYDFKAESTLYIGDHDHDKQFASNSGMSFLHYDANSEIKFFSSDLVKRQTKNRINLKMVQSFGNYFDLIDLIKSKAESKTLNKSALSL